MIPRFLGRIGSEFLETESPRNRRIVEPWASKLVGFQTRRHANSKVREPVIPRFLRRVGSKFLETESSRNRGIIEP